MLDLLSSYLALGLFIGIVDSLSYGIRYYCRSSSDALIHRQAILQGVLLGLFIVLFIFFFFSFFIIDFLRYRLKVSPSQISCT